MRREETSSLTPLNAAIQMWPLAVSQQPIKTTPDQPRPSLLEQKQKESLLGDVLVDQARAHLLVPLQRIRSSFSKDVPKTQEQQQNSKTISFILK